MPIAPFVRPGFASFLPGNDLGVRPALLGPPFPIDGFFPSDATSPKDLIASHVEETITFGWLSMELLTPQDRLRLLANGQLRGRAEEDTSDPNIDFMPVVKLFTPDADCTWLLTELDPGDTDRAFGLCDLGLGFPELGWVSLPDLRNIRGSVGLPVERDVHFVPSMPLSGYLSEARRARRIID